MDKGGASAAFWPRDLSQIGQESPRVSTLAGLEYEALFDKFFDYELYSDSTHTQEHLAASSPLRSTHRDSSPFIVDIPYFFDHLSLGRDEAGYPKMTPGLNPDDGITTSESMGQTPPGLVRGGSTSPSSPSSPSGSFSLEGVDDPRRRPRHSLREVRAQDDEWTYPQAVPSKHAPRGYGYPPQVHVHESSSRRSSHSSKTYSPPASTSGVKRQRSVEKRSRHLSDPDQTADVRKSGACLPCRISKTRCQDCGVCPFCRKAFPDHSHLVCTRRTPAVAPPVIRRIADVWSPDPVEERRVVDNEPRFPTAKPKDILIYFTRDAESPYLRASVQAYHSKYGVDESPRNAAFERDRFPSYVELQRWVEAQIRRERSSRFEHVVQNFLLSYYEEGQGLPKHNLVSKVHTMNCFFRIWKAPRFTCCSSSNKISQVPFTVQAELRRIAWNALVSHEHDILKLLEDVLAQQDSLKAQEKMAVWASLWQLMLMYRDLIIAHDGYFSRNPSAQKDQNTVGAFENLYNSFFPLIAMFYHCQFKTPKRMEMSMDWLKDYPSHARHSAKLRQVSQDMMDAKREFYERVQRSSHKVDERLCAFVVNHEMKKISTKRRPRSSTKSKGA
ncbi:hypothetical protein FSPOR_8210 [Fusarium sporotrichioides]|jgi:hypothetical protein|uniref:Uncharacterized protein n=1 Tax=Fusarium sporotrichioides TaxID=5514 RepID=A0A395RVL3_FUSSP|nr:hypothetical protein FSPOR_8210 [Fusarium sporotrichioides]